MACRSVISKAMRSGGNRKAGHGLHDPVGEIGGGHGKRRHVEEELSGKTPLGGLLKGLLEDGEVQ